MVGGFPFRPFAIGECSGTAVHSTTIGVVVRLGDQIIVLIVTDEEKMGHAVLAEVEVRSSLPFGIVSVQIRIGDDTDLRVFQSDVVREELVPLGQIDVLIPCLTRSRWVDVEFHGLGDKSRAVAGQDQVGVEDARDLREFGGDEVLPSVIGHAVEDIRPEVGDYVGWVARADGRGELRQIVLEIAFVDSGHGHENQRCVVLALHDVWGAHRPYQHPAFIVDKYLHCFTSLPII